MNELSKWVPGGLSEMLFHLFEGRVPCFFRVEEVFQVPAVSLVLNVLAEVGDLVVVNPSSSCGLDVKQP